jgi:hypothetical protein
VNEFDLSQVGNALDQALETFAANENKLTATETRIWSLLALTRSELDLEIARQIEEDIALQRAGT